MAWMRGDHPNLRLRVFSTFATLVREKYWCFFYNLVKLWDYTSHYLFSDICCISYNWIWITGKCETIWGCLWVPKILILKSDLGAVVCLSPILGLEAMPWDIAQGPTKSWLVSWVEGRVGGWGMKNPVPVPWEPQCQAPEAPWVEEGGVLTPPSVC